MIKDLLTKKGLSIYQCSKISGIPYTTLNEIVNGKTRIEKCSVMTIYSLSKVLNISMEYLIENNIDNFDFELFKSNISHDIVINGQMNYIVKLLKSDEITKLYNEDNYLECFYKLAMLDYLSRLNNLPICTKYDYIRCNKLKDVVYPRDILVRYELSHTDKILEESIRESIPEFIRFNIVENEVLNVR